MRLKVAKLAAEHYYDLFGDSFDDSDIAWLRTLPEDLDKLEELTLEEAGYELSMGMFDCVESALRELE